MSFIVIIFVNVGVIGVIDVIGVIYEEKVRYLMG
jgi:hypothetical protein